MSHQSAPSPIETSRAPAVALPHLSLLIDPVQRAWDAAGYSDRSICLHAFDLPCDLATMFWDELHYTVRIVLRAHIQRFFKRGQVAA